MRIFFKHTMCSVAFIAGLCSLLAVVSIIITPKNNAKGSGIEDPTANGILSEEDGTIDVLVLGDSESYCSIVPLKIWNDHGITSYVCGTPDQKLAYSEEFLIKAFKTQTPKMVILETNTIYRDFSYKDAVKYKADNLFPVFRYHNRWKNLSNLDFSFAINYTYTENSKGYHFNTSVAEASDSEYMKPSDQATPIPPKCKDYVESINNFCKENNAKLVLLSTPTTKNWDTMKHNGIQGLAEELDLEYIDMNLMMDKILIDWKKDSRDKGDHLNYFGAKKVSEYIGKYLANSGVFEDHRGNALYDDWNSALKKFFEETKSAGSS